MAASTPRTRSRTPHPNPQTALGCASNRTSRLTTASLRTLKRLVGKLICCGSDRGEATGRALRARRDSDYHGRVPDQHPRRSQDPLGRLQHRLRHATNGRVAISTHAHQPHYGLHRDEQQAVAPRRRRTLPAPQNTTLGTLMTGSGKNRGLSDPGYVRIASPRGQSYPAWCCRSLLRTVATPCQALRIDSSVGDLAKETRDRSNDERS